MFVLTHGYIWIIDGGEIILGNIIGITGLVKNHFLKEPSYQKS